MTDTSSSSGPILSRRSILKIGAGGAIVIAASSVTAACASETTSGGTAGDGSGDGSTVRQTTGLIVEFSPFFIADARGLFEKHGVQGGLRGFVIANDGAKAMLAGEFDTATLVELPSLRYLAEGSDLISTAVVVTARNLKLVGRDISGPEDLVGKRVAYPFGTGQDFGFAAYLEKYDIDPESVEHVNAENADLVPLIARGDVDAICAVEPQVGQVLDQIDGTSEVQPAPYDAYQTRSHLIVQRDWAQENGEGIVGVLRALDEAAELIRQEPEEAAEIVAGVLRSDAESVQALWEANQDDFSLYLDDAAEQAFQQVAEWLVSKGELEAAPPLDDFFDRSYLEQL